MRDLKERNVLIAGICAAVDVLDDSGILQDVRSTHSTNEDLVNDKNIITARAFYKRLGFTEGKLTEEFGSPVQEFVFKR